MLDVDHFKSINDQFGHLAGDAYLTTLVRELHTLLRSEDLLARYGGEEFCAAVVVDDQTSALQLAERLRAHTAQLQVHFEGQILQTTVSIGVALLDEAANESNAVEVALKSADESLYQVKHRGRNGVHCSTLSSSPANMPPPLAA